jgi:drug/metabolite transporter (DMT)-like permease
MVLANTVVAYMLWYQAVRWLPASRVAVFNNLQPPLTVALGALAWGETVTMPFLAGASLALLGVIWTQRS